MLNPDNRTLYFDALKPPAGYELDYAVAASYSLNLSTLVMLPLAMSKYRNEFEQKEKIDKIKLLEALENNYEKMTIFCQKGQIAIPKNVNILYSFLEDTIIETQIKDGTKAFHPKIWILRFINNNLNIKYRLIVSSRNITFDKSWDTILVLEGEKSDHNGKNKELINFIKFLFSNNTTEISKKQKNKINEIVKELSEINFEAPADFDDYLVFKSLGIKKDDNWFFKKDYDRALIISPFLSSNILNKFKGNNNILISRKSEIDKIYTKIKNKFSKIYLIDDILEKDLDLDNNLIDSEIDLRSGLHAKIYLLEDQVNDKLYLYTGSANATNAAFNGNLEFLVGLRKTNPKLTLKDLIEVPDEDQIKFSSILTPYIPNPDLEKEEKAEKKLDELKRKLLDLDLYLEVEEENIDNKKLYNLSIKLKNNETQILERDNSEIYCWPVTLKKEKYYKNISKLPRNDILFSSLTIESLTSFIAFEIKTDNNQTSFVLNLNFEKEVEKRKEKILTSIISDQNKFIKFLYLLLQDKDQMFLTNQQSFFKSKGNSGNNRNAFGLPLMEDLLKTLTDNVNVIDRIEKIVKELESSDEKRIPSEFYDIWEAIIDIRREEIE